MARKDPDATKKYNAAYYQAHKGERKTHTSSAVKRRYNDNHYKHYRALIKPELFDRIEAYSKKESLSRSQFLARAIDILDK